MAYDDVISFSDEEKLELINKEPRFKPVIDRLGDIQRAAEPDLFRCLIVSIAGQQVSGSSQKALVKKIEQTCDNLLTPASILKLSEVELRALGCTRPKASYMLEAAKYFSKLSERQLQDLKALPKQEFIKELSQIKGVGEWTAEMLLLFSLKRKDILSINDLGIRKGIQEFYGYQELSVERAYALQSLLSDSASLASLYFWELSKSYAPSPEPAYLMAYESPFGWLYAQSSKRGLVFVKYESQLSELDQQYFKLEENRDALLTYLAHELDRYFKGKLDHFSIPLDYQAYALTPFAQRVYESLKNLDFSQFTSYKGLAEMAGSPRAARAVGNLMAKNPWPIVVPCHKVLKADNTLGGFSLPIELKCKLLEHEHILFKQ